MARAGWRHPDGVRFQKQAPYGNLLRKAYKGQVRGALSTSTPDGTQILRPGAVGLFNLKSFLRVVPQPDRKAQGPQPESGELPESKALLPESKLRGEPDRGESVEQGGVQLSYEDRLESMQTTVADIRRANWQEVDGGWSKAHALALAPKASLDQRHHAVVARGRYAESVRDMDTKLRQLEPDGKPERLLRLEHAREALRLALPGLGQGPVVEGMDDSLHGWVNLDEGGRPSLLQSTLQALVQVSDRLAQAGVSDFGVDRLITALSHGSIRDASNDAQGADTKQTLRETKDGRQEAPKLRALRSLQGLAQLMLDATAPGSDGAALNGLLGRSSEFDAAIRALRIQAATQCLLVPAEHKGEDSKWQQEHNDRQSEAAAKKDATALVDRQIDIARARCRLMRAFDLAGIPRPVNGVSSVRMDDYLLSVLRSKIGPERADEVGLVLAALRLMEEASAQSPEAIRLSDALKRRSPHFGGMGPADEDDKKSSYSRDRKLHSPMAQRGPDGLDTEEARTLGLSTAEARVIGLSTEVDPRLDHKGRRVRQDRDAQRIISLARQGFCSAHDALAACIAINNIIDRVLGHLTPERFSDEKRTYVRGARDDDAARQLGDLLLRNLTNDMSLSLTGARNEQRDAVTEAMRRAMAPLDTLRAPVGHAEPEDEVHGVARDEDEVGEAGMPLIPRESGESRQAGAHQKRFNPVDYTRTRLEKLGDEHAQLQRGLEETLRLSQDRQQDSERALALVRGYGERIDPHAPSCRDACLLLNGLLEQFGDQAVAGEPEPREFSAEAAGLRGFDERRLQTSRWGGVALTWSRFQALVNNQDLVDAVAAVAKLAANDGAIHSYQSDIIDTVTSMDKTLRRRRKLLPQAMPERLDDAIRAAILLHRDSKTPVLQYRPADQAGKIKATLREWGVPVDQLLPEIDTALSESFGPDELNLWREGLYLSESYRVNQDAWHRQHQNALSSKPADAPDTKAPAAASQETRAALQEAVDNLQQGARTKLQVGWKGEGQSGGLMIVPGVGVNVKVSYGQMAILEIGSTPECFDISLRLSEDWKLGVDTIVGPGAVPLFRLAEEAGAAAGVNVPAEVGRAKATGFVLRFPPTDAGRLAMKAVLDALVTRGGIGRHLPGVEQVAPVMDVKYAGKVGVSFKLGWGSLEIPSKVADKHVDAFIGARSGASVGGQYMNSREGNVNYTTRKTEREFNVELSASAGMSAVIGLPRRGGDDKHKTGTDLLDIGGTWTGMYKRKTKEIRDLYGQVQKGTEWQRQVAVPGKLASGALRKMVGPEFEAMMQDLRESKSEANRKSAHDIDSMIRAAGPNDVISVASTLDERVREQVNELLAQASAKRASVPANAVRGLLQRQPAEPIQAQALEKQAQDLLDSPRSYIVARITLIATRESATTLPVVSGIWVKGSQQVEDKGEFITTEIKPDPLVARDAHDRVLQLAAGDF